MEVDGLEHELIARTAPTIQRTARTMLRGNCHAYIRADLRADPLNRIDFTHDSGHVFTVEGESWDVVQLHRVLFAIMFKRYFDACLTALKTRDCYHHLAKD